MAKITTTIDFFPLGLILFTICILGLIGNIMCAIVLTRTRMRSTYSILTLGLTFCDGLYLLTKLIRYGLLSMFVHFDVFDGYTEVFYPIFGPYLRALTFTAHSGSTYFTMVVAVDRYISVCWPVKARFLCTKRRAHIAVVSVLLFSFIYNLPRWFEFHTEITKTCSNLDLEGFNTTFSHDGSGSDTCSLSLYVMKQSKLRDDETYKIYYIFWLYFIIMFLLPFTSLTYFNCAIFHAIRQSAKARLHLTSQQKRETSFAIMLFSVVIVFLVCSFDYLVLDILSYLKIPYARFWDRLGNVLLSINSAANFLIYCAFGRKFRKEFFQFINEISGGRFFKRQIVSSASRGISGSDHNNVTKSVAVSSV